MTKNDYNLMRFFAPQECISYNGFMPVFLDNDVLRDKEGFNFNSSYHVLDARLIGLSYPDYLLWVVKNYNAKLGGKGGYCYPYFEKITDCQKFCRVLEEKFRDFLKLSGLLEVEE